jgi:LmbE family N-acetylglucosaminyl deacetylase
MEPPGLDLSRLLVVSPHFDDAVFSCGHLLSTAPGAVVVTVFGGRPDTYPSPVCPWDADCGFGEDSDIVATRRAEDEEALATLDAVPVVLDFVEGQYRRPTRYSASEIAGALADVVRRVDPTAVALPLAIRHSDHRLSMAAALQVRTPNERRHWIAYGEFPYVWRRPDGQAARIAHLRRRGIGMTPILGIPQDRERKATAMRSYASQLRGFAFPDLERVAGVAEQLWLLSRRPLADPLVIARVTETLRRSLPSR